MILAELETLTRTWLYRETSPYWDRQCSCTCVDIPAWWQHFSNVQGYVGDLRITKWHQKDLPTRLLGAKVLCIGIAAAGLEDKSLVEENDHDHV